MSRDASYLSTVGRDLTVLAAKSKLQVPLHRDASVDRIVESLDRGRSVLLVGPEGVGKSAVVHGLACRMAEKSGGKRGKRLLLELSTGNVMTGTKYLGEWETRAAKIADHAVRANAVLCWSDVWNLPHAGVSSKSPSNLFELYRPRMTEGGLLMIGELTLDGLAKAERVGGFMSMFDVVRIDALSADELRAILQRYVAGLRLGATDATLQRVTELCDQFLPATVGPGQPLRLLERVRHYADEKAAKGEPEPMGPEFVEKVFSIYSGLPRFVVDANSTVRVNDIGRWFHDRVMGQEAAVDAVVESIVLFKAAINDPGRPLGTFL